MFKFLLPLVTLGKKMTGNGLLAVRKELFALGGGDLMLRKMAFLFVFYSV